MLQCEYAKQCYDCVKQFRTREQLKLRNRNGKLRIKAVESVKKKSFSSSTRIVWNSVEKCEFRSGTESFIITQNKRDSITIISRGMLKASMNYMEVIESRQIWFFAWIGEEKFWVIRDERSEESGLGGWLNVKERKRSLKLCAIFFCLRLKRFLNAPLGLLLCNLRIVQSASTSIT